MAPLVSRVLVALVGLPLVLLVVWAGGWWLFALVAVAAVLALHEYALMIRSLRPRSEGKGAKVPDEPMSESGWPSRVTVPRL